MADAKLIRERPTKRSANALEKTLGLKHLAARKEPAAEDIPKPAGVSPTVLGQIMRWIPTETITLYVAYLALLNPVVAKAGKKVCEAGGFDDRWAGVVVFAALTPVVVLLVYIAKVRGTKQPFRWPVWEMAAATLAFLAWAFALPDTPLLSVCGYKVEIGAFIVLVTTIAIGLVADALGKNVKAAD
jgi:hypothetical protein